MMHLEPENDYWSTKALRLADLMENLWTGKNDRGMLQFKSTYFSADALNLEPQKSCDTFYHPRAVQPALLYWQRTGDERLTKLFSSWMDTWVDAAAREENGKPAGILPSAIHWPDGKVGGLSEDWWDPRNYSPPSIYAWPGVMRIMNDTLLLTYHITGDENYLAPLRSMARIRAGYTKAPGEPPPVPGSQDWCASKLGGITSALAKYRFLTGSDEFDELLEAEKSPYIALRMSNEWKPVTSALASVAEALRYNFESNTSEVRWTDRVFTFPRLFGNNGIYEEALPGFRRPWIDLLYSTATGDPGTVGYFPMNAVRWLTEPRDIAAIVTQAGTDTFEAQLYHFGEDVRRMGAEFYLLSFGDEGDEDQIEYRYELWEAIEEEPKWHQLARGDVTVEQNKGVIRFELPRQALYELRVIPK